MFGRGGKDKRPKNWATPAQKNAKNKTPKASPPPTRGKGAGIGRGRGKGQSGG